MAMIWKNPVRRILLILGTAAAFGVLSSIAIPVWAGHYAGWFTGYAMGNRYGGAGVELRQGHFANHYYRWCPNDPAAWWTWGTRIDTDSPIRQSTQSGGSIYYSTFYLEDVGDPSCSMGNYWVDIYFGRWENRPPSDPNYCYCSGVPSPGFCYAASANSCSDAINFGRQYRGYTGP